MPFDPSSLWDVSHLATFVGGALVGGAGQYLADRFTDQRRKQETSARSRKEFQELRDAMSDLFTEMSADLRADSSKSIREFVICPNPRVIFNSAKPRFAYYESEHSNLRVFVDRLHEAGYVSDVTVGNAPIYRMTEAFVESLLKNAG